MKILLDECVPWPMRKILVGHTCTTAQKRGWDAITNGELINLAETEFDLFVTCDQNIRYQQNLTNRKIAILELGNNELRRIMAAAAEICDAIANIPPGGYVHIEIPRIPKP